MKTRNNINFDKEFEEIQNYERQLNTLVNYLECFEGVTTEFYEKYLSGIDTIGENGAWREPQKHVCEAELAIKLIRETIAKNREKIHEGVVLGKVNDFMSDWKAS